ncbi:uncharacterized protein C11orf52 homolog isoform X1 [Fukomys damarensis]|uniref:Uncharacterized protein n=1 Tax=Fukomys damarensis TaxID=885580 RepID=A0A091CRC9_FUKDA|nr:uncharacterized protein C11orf52 homolog isoform X1 [Fukomys damarensis]KFO20737.1 hypothetical protein H920_17900 [Fukomys damarensis]
MHKPLYVEKQLGSLGDRAPWETGSVVGEIGSQARCTLKRQQQKLRQNSTKDHRLTGYIGEQVLQQPVSQKRSQNLTSEESNLHYADIQVFSHIQPRSASEVKHLQLENATEYATLYFPQATPRYDSKNGTLV